MLDISGIPRQAGQLRTPSVAQGPASSSMDRSDPSAFPSTREETPLNPKDKLDKELIAQGYANLTEPMILLEQLAKEMKVTPGSQSALDLDPAWTQRFRAAFPELPDSLFLSIEVLLPTGLTPKIRICPMVVLMDIGCSPDEIEHLCFTPIPQSWHRNIITKAKMQAACLLPLQVKEDTCLKNVGMVSKEPLPSSSKTFPAPPTPKPLMALPTPGVPPVPLMKSLTLLDKRVETLSSVTAEPGPSGQAQVKNPPRRKVLVRPSTPAVHKAGQPPPRPKNIVKPSPAASADPEPLGQDQAAPTPKRQVFVLAVTERNYSNIIMTAEHTTVVQSWVSSDPSSDPKALDYQTPTLPRARYLHPPRSTAMGMGCGFHIERHAPSQQERSTQLTNAQIASYRHLATTWLDAKVNLDTQAVRSLSKPLAIPLDLRAENNELSRLSWYSPFATQVDGFQTIYQALCFDYMTDVAPWQERQWLKEKIVATSGPVDLNGFLRDHQLEDMKQLTPADQMYAVRRLKSRNRYMRLGKGINVVYEAYLSHLAKDGAARSALINTGTAYLYLDTAHSYWGRGPYSPGQKSFSLGREGVFNWGGIILMRVRRQIQVEILLDRQKGMVLSQYPTSPASPLASLEGSTPSPTPPPFASGVHQPLPAGSYCPSTIPREELPLETVRTLQQVRVAPVAWPGMQVASNQESTSTTSMAPRMMPALTQPMSPAASWMQPWPVPPAGHEAPP